MDHKKKFRGGYVLFLVVLCIMFLGIFSTCSLATNEWNLTFEKQTYENLKYFYDNYTMKSGTNFNQNLWNESTVFDIWANIYNVLENSNYTQEEYKYMAINYNSSTKTLQINLSNNAKITFYNSYWRIELLDDNNENNIIYFNVVLNDTYQVTSVSNITERTQNWYSRVSYGTSSSEKGNSMYLSKNINSVPGSSESGYIKNSWATTSRLNYNFNETSNNATLDTTIQTENFSIECQMDIGGFYQNYNTDVYYYSGDQKISIKNYIVNNPEVGEYWWGVRINPYIPKENFNNIPENTQFYITLRASHNNGGSNNVNYVYQPNFTKTLEEKKAFKTGRIEEINPTPTPTPTSTSTPTPTSTPSGESPYPTPIDYNDRFDDIDNSLNGISGELGNISGFLDAPISTSTNDFENAFDAGEEDVDDPTDDFFTWFFNNIRTCFEVNSNQVLNFTILGNNFKVNSDDYILDIPILTTVIGYGCGIFIFYCIFCDIRKEIEKVKEGKFADIGSDDISANMM